MLTSFDFMAAWITSRIRSERGASLVEYALLVALIAAVCIGAVKIFGSNANDTFTNAGNAVTVTAFTP